LSALFSNQSGTSLRGVLTRSHRGKIRIFLAPFKETTALIDGLRGNQNTHTRRIEAFEHRF
tara:strand:+ start:2078 stop:2260 length:183 start_codon:yes stop_codon:yes gene_type:complete